LSVEAPSGRAPQGVGVLGRDVWVECGFLIPHPYHTVPISVLMSGFLQPLFHRFFLDGTKFEVLSREGMGGDVGVIFCDGDT